MLYVMVFVRLWSKGSTTWVGVVGQRTLGSVRIWNNNILIILITSSLIYAVYVPTWAWKTRVYNIYVSPHSIDTTEWIHLDCFQHLLVKEERACTLMYASTCVDPTLTIMCACRCMTHCKHYQATVEPLTGDHVQHNACLVRVYPLLAQIS